MEYKAYSFDLDDNLLKLPTVVYLENEKGEQKEFSTSEFEKVRNKLNELNLSLIENSFSNFSDDEQFFNDLENSEEAGSWRNLINCISKHANIFAIITARRHPSDVIKKGLKNEVLKRISKEELLNFRKIFSEKFNYLIKDETDEELLEIYFGYCKFYPVNNPEIKNKFGSNLNTSELKYLAFQEFQLYVNDHVKKMFGEKCKVKIGFSDDSVIHLKTMINNVLKKHGLFFYQTNDGGKSLI
jgi:hypothetical protein